MIKIGLTGGIGSGKSTVARVFGVLGIPVFEADKAGRELLDTDLELRGAIIERFGGHLYSTTGLDRKALAEVVFRDTHALKDLNALVHPKVRAAFKQWIAVQNAPYVIMEAAILVESGGHRHMDRLIVVTAPEELRLQRVMGRDNADRKAVLQRIRNQVSDAERLRAAHHVVQNDGTVLVLPQLLAIHQELLNLASS